MAADSNIDIKLRTVADNTGIDKILGGLRDIDKARVSVQMPGASRPARISDTQSKSDIASAAKDAQDAATRAFLALSRAKAPVPKPVTDSLARLSDVLKNIDPVNIPKATKAISEFEKSLTGMTGLPLKYAEKQLAVMKKRVHELAVTAKSAAADVKNSFSSGELVSAALSGDIKGMTDQLLAMLATVKKFPNALKGIGNMGVGQMAIIYKGIEGFQKVFNAIIDRWRGGVRELARQRIDAISNGLDDAKRLMERFAIATDLATGKLLKQIEVERSRREAMRSVSAAQTDREEAMALTGSKSEAERNAIEMRFATRRQLEEEDNAWAELAENRRADEATAAANAKKIEARKKSIDRMRREQGKLTALENEGMEVMSKDEARYFGRLKQEYGLADFSVDEMATMKELQKRIDNEIVAATDALNAEEADQQALQGRIALYAEKEEALAAREAASAAKRAKDREDRRIAEDNARIEQMRRERDLRLDEERMRESAADANSERRSGLKKQIENAKRRAEDRARMFRDADKEYSDFLASLGDKAADETKLTPEEKSRRDDLRARRTRFLGEKLDADNALRDRMYEMEKARQQAREEKADRDYAQREADIEAAQQARIRRGGDAARYRIAQENVERREAELADRQAYRDALRARLKGRYGENASLADLGGEDRRQWDRAVARVVESMNSLRSARSELDSMEIERRKALTGVMLGGAKQSNRLTAMGLAGDVSSWNRDTARNTGKMVTLLERNLAASRGTGRQAGSGWALNG